MLLASIVSLHLPGANDGEAESGELKTSCIQVVCISTDVATV